MEDNTIPLRFFSFFLSCFNVQNSRILIFLLIRKRHGNFSYSRQLHPPQAGWKGKQRGLLSIIPLVVLCHKLRDNWRCPLFSACFFFSGLRATSPKSATRTSERAFQTVKRLMDARSSGGIHIRRPTRTYKSRGGEHNFGTGMLGFPVSSNGRRVKGHQPRRPRTTLSGPLLISRVRVSCDF